MDTMSHDTMLAMATLVVNGPMSHNRELAMGTLAVNVPHVS